MFSTGSSLRRRTPAVAVLPLPDFDLPDLDFPLVEDGPGSDEEEEVVAAALPVGLTPASLSVEGPMSLLSVEGSPMSMSPRPVGSSEGP